MEELNKEISKCQKCEGSGCTIKRPFGEVGSSPLMFVLSEGLNSDTQEKLTWMVEEILGVASAKCYMTYLVKGYLPDGRVPLPEEIQNCKGWLEQEIAIVKPRVIVALGKTAANVLTNLQGVLGFFRGKVMDCYLDTGGVSVVIPTFSPDYFVRAGKDVEKGLREDMDVVRRELERLGIWEKLRLGEVGDGDDVLSENTESDEEGDVLC